MRERGGENVPRWTIPQSWMYLTAFIIVRTRSAASLWKVEEKTKARAWTGQRWGLIKGEERWWDVRLVVVSFGAYAVKELAAGAEVEDEVEVVCGLARRAGE